MGVYFKRGGKVGMPQQLLRDLCINARVVQYGSIFVPQRMAVYVAGPHSTPRFAAPFLVLVGQPMRPAEPFPAFIQSGFADRGSAAYLREDAARAVQGFCEMAPKAGRCARLSLFSREILQAGSNNRQRLLLWISYQR